MNLLANETQTLLERFTECNKWLRDKNLTEIEWIQR